MRVRFLHNLWGLAGLFLALASCSPPTSPQAGGGIGGTGSLATVSSGPITKFGSVFVSGTEYDNSHALYCIDDEPCTSQNTLKLGMVVRVNGTRTTPSSTNQAVTRTADVITYEESVEGIVQSVAPDGLSLVLLGQIISVNQRTEIEPALQGLTAHELNLDVVPGALVEISGFVTGDGTILATLITRQVGPPHYEIEGQIKNHDVLNHTFEVGALRVVYSGADISQMPPPTSRSWNGLIAFTRGAQWNQGGPGPNGAELTATRVKLESLGVENIEEAEVEDFITQVLAPGDFFINNQRVLSSNSTGFEGGTIADLVLGAHVEVEGSLVNDVLQAGHISFVTETELESNIATVDTSAMTLTMAGFPGVMIAIDSHSTIGGEGNPSRIADLHAGDHLKIDGRRGTGGAILATEIERSSPASNVKLEGLVISASDPLLVVAGVTIDTTAIPDGGFKGDNGVVIGRSAFFSGLTNREKVAVKGSLSGTVIQWVSVSRRD